MATTYIYDYIKFRPQFNTLALLTADTTLSYSATGNKYRVDEDDLVHAGLDVYKVAASGASDQDLTTAGGVKLYLQSVDIDDLGDVAISSPADGEVLTYDSVSGGWLNDTLPSTAPSVNAQTGTSYTLALTDANDVVTMSNASANTLTIPTNASVAFPAGTVISVIQQGAGATTIAGDTGVTVNGVSAGSADLSAQYSAVSLVKVATDEWNLAGDHGGVS